MSTPRDDRKLREEFRRIKEHHLLALRRTASRVVLGSSVIRVFVPDTKPKLQDALDAIDVDALGSIRTQEQYREWFERFLSRLARVINKTNHNNPRVQPGYKWGHGTKILCLWVRDIVLNSRYFNDQQVERISPWLYAPIDSVVIRRLCETGLRPPFRAIKQIDSPEKFYEVQDALKFSADHAGVPRIWFDDNWGDRQ